MDFVAAGAGLSTALACDVRIGSEHARFKTTFVERSLSPDSGMSWLLPRIVGLQRAKELMLSAREIDAAEAKVDALREKLTGLDIDALSPRAALDLLYDLKRAAGAGPRPTSPAPAPSNPAAAASRR